MRYSNSIISGAAIIADTAILIGSGLVIHAFYIGYSVDGFGAYASVLTISTVLMITFFHLGGLYRVEPTNDLADQLRRIVSITTTLFFVMVAVAFSLKVSAQFSRVWVFSWFLSANALLALHRVCIHYLVDRSARQGHLTRNTVIIGAQEQGARLLEALRQHEYPWIRILGFFDDRTARVPPTVGELPVLGDVDGLIEYARKNRCDDVLIALPWSAAQRIVQIIAKLDILPINVRLAPDLAGLELARCPYGEFSGVPVLNILERPLDGWNSIFKSVLDRILAVGILIVFAPLMLLIALLIKLDSPGPVLFRQKRYGFNNRAIEILKFRTLRHDRTDDDAAQLVTQGDARVTRFGAFLRRTSLDEFPQFLSVLKGEMSIVGPRPHAFKASAAGKLYEEAVAQYAMRHKVKPGITGWAQVNGWRGETDTEEKIIKRFEHDIYYIRNWSLLLDLRIILRTALIFFRQQNAY